MVGYPTHYRNRFYFIVFHAWKYYMLEGFTLYNDLGYVIIKIGPRGIPEQGLT